MHTLSQGNYLYLNGTVVKIKELHQDNTITVCYQDGTQVRVSDKDLRYIELTGSNVILRLMSEEDTQVERTVFSLIKTTKHQFHTKEEYCLNLGGVKFYLSGFLYEDKSIWSFSNLITLHYLHQLQNLLAILNPAIPLILSIS